MKWGVACETILVEKRVKNECEKAPLPSSPLRQKKVVVRAAWRGWGVHLRATIVFETIIHASRDERSLRFVSGEAF